eukprot:scaffold137934_cov20-Tisochrysis_lutea.AAC.2
MEKGRGGLQDQSTGTWHGLGDGGVQELSKASRQGNSAQGARAAQRGKGMLGMRVRFHPLTDPQHGCS